MTLVCGIDSSTQSCKVVIRDLATGTLVRSGRAGHPEGTEVDPGAWWNALLAAIDDGGGLDDVAAVSVAGQQHGMVVLDTSGRIIRPALLWNDGRSAQAALDLIAEVGAAAYARRTGAVPVASFTATKLRWLRDAEPENAARVAAVALPHDWLTWRLRGYGPAGQSPLGPVLQELTTDRSEASGTAYWSPSTGDYDLELFGQALGHAAILPRVLGPAEAAGRTAALPRVPAGIVVGPGAGDNAGAALGLGAGPGDVVVSIGTSGHVGGVDLRAWGVLKNLRQPQGTYDVVGLPLAPAILRGVAADDVLAVTQQFTLDGQGAFLDQLGVGLQLKQLHLSPGHRGELLGAGSSGFGLQAWGFGPLDRRVREEQLLAVSVGPG